MRADVDDGQRVRLKTRLLGRLMDERGWSAHRIHQEVGEPTKRTINRWLKRGRGSTEGLVPTSWRYVVAVADAIGVPATELVDRPPASETEGAERLLRVAAALGTRVYPDLLEDLGIRATDADLTGAGLEPETAEGDIWRFERWSHCERVLAEGTALPQAFARKARAWAEEVGLEPGEAPELYTMTAIALGDARDAWRSGLEWMRLAVRRGVLLEAAWVGERLTRADLIHAEVAAAVRGEVLLLLSRGYRLHGRVGPAMDVITEIALGDPFRGDPVMQGRVQLEMARLRRANGQMIRAVSEAKRAVAKLESVRSQAPVQLLEALIELAHLAERVGDDRSHMSAIEAMTQLARGPGGVTGPRYHRLLGVGAMAFGKLEEAKAHFLHALDTAVAEGNVRETGGGRLNVALVHALLDEPEYARSYFEQAVSYVDGGEAGVVLAAVVHMNFAEFELQEGRPEAAFPHLHLAIGQLERGEFPSLMGRCMTLLAEGHTDLSQLEEAQEYSRKACRFSLISEHPLHQAEALSGFAYARVDEPEVVRSTAERIDEFLGQFSEEMQVLERLVIERRLAIALLRTFGDEKSVDHATGVARRAEALGLKAEARRLLAAARSDIGAPRKKVPP